MTGSEAPGLLAQALRVALARELGQPTEAGLPVVPAGQVDLFLDSAAQHRVSTVLLPVVDDLGLPEPAIAEVRAIHAAQVRASMPVQAANVLLIRELAATGIRCLAYKGVALAERTTGDPAARGVGDVDLLFDPRDMPAVHVALEGLGARLVPGWTPPPGSDLWPLAERLRPEAPYVWRGIDIDVHWRLDRLPQVMSVAFDDLWERRALAEVGGASVPTLGPRDALLATCAHGTKEHWRQWRWVVDAVRQATQLPAGEWPGLRTHARAAGCEQALAIGLAIAGRLAPHPFPLVPGDWARGAAEQAWAEGATGENPFGRITAAKQVERLRWTIRTRPDDSSLASLAAQVAWSTQDMAEVPLPPALAGLYPLLRPYLWARRLRQTAQG